MPPTNYRKTIEDARIAGKQQDPRFFKAPEAKAALSQLLKEDQERAAAKGGSAGAFDDAEHEAQRRATYGKHR